MIDINAELGKNPVWKNHKCARCGRTPDKSVLNIEARIHHNAKEIICVDHKSCSKHTKRKK